MKSISNLSKIQNVTAAIGIFDGVHKAHQKILKKLVQEAKRLKTKSLVITFHPHPAKVLNPYSNVPFLTSLEHRLRLIEEIGVDYFYVIKFTRTISKMPPDEFIKKVLINKLRIKALVVGQNFLFGHKEKGNILSLKQAGDKYNFKVYNVKQVKIKKEIISSTKIRKKIERGELKNASIMLGRPVTVLGTVVGGRRIGRKLGFPTANINPHHESIPPSGVYAVDVKLGRDKMYKGVLNIGTRPTFGKRKEPSQELHILNFKKNIYGKDIEIMFKKKIREEQKFPSIQALRNQIKKDIDMIR